MAGFKEYQMLFQLNASTGSGFNATFASGASSISQLQDKINALNKTNSDISSYQKQQSAIDKTKAKIDLYQTQLQNLQNATANTSKEEAELANAIAAKEKQLTDATAKLDEQNAALSETGQALREAGVDTNNLADESERLKAEAAEVAKAQKEEAEAAEEAGQSMKDAMQGAAAALEAAGIVAGLKAVYSALQDCSQVAAEFETSMAGVKRTVGGSDQFISDLGDSFQQLSTEIPITATELANIATTAGQLGIAQDNVETFSTVMAKLATTTDLSADSAATMLAQFSNITGVTDYERLGSAVAALGDSTATTASKVVDMSQGMAAAASLAGMSSTDILAISAAVGSLGIEAASGSTSMSQLITKLYKATETGDQLEEIAAVAGMTGAEFKTAWGTDAVGAMDAFIQGLNNVEQNGASAVVVLDQLGINNVRQTKAILGLASAGDLLSNTISVANNAWNENTALTEKAGVMYGTTEAKLTMMGNAANNVKIAVGDALNPAIGTASEAITDLLEPIAEWLSANPAVVQGIAAFVGALGVATAGIVGYTAVTKLAAAASALFSLSIPGIGLILGVAAAIGAVVAAISALTGGANAASKSFEEMDAEYDSLMNQFTEDKKVLDLVDDYRTLSKETENLQKLMSGDFSTEVVFKGKTDDDGKLTPDDFVDGNTVQLTPDKAHTLAANDFLSGSVVKLTPEQAHFLAGQSFLETQYVKLTPEQEKFIAGQKFLSNTKVKLTPEQAEYMLGKDFVKDTKVKLTPEQKAKLKSTDFIDGTKVIELTPHQFTTLAAKGFLTNNDARVMLEPGVIDAMDAADLLTGTEVTLTGAAGEALESAGLLDSTTVELSAHAANDLKQSQFYTDSKVVVFTGEADKEHPLTAADFGVSDTTLVYVATMDENSVDEVQKKAASLQEQVVGAFSDLSNAKQSLNESVAMAEVLTRKIAGTDNKTEKTVLQGQLDALNQSITTQQENVETLQNKYDSLSGEYNTVSAVAEELSGKEAELLTIKQQLSGAIGDVTTASEKQAEAFDNEADAAEHLKKASMEDARNQMYASIIEQSGAYVRSLKDEETAEANRNKTLERQAKIQAQITDNVSNNSAAIEKQFEDTRDLYYAWKLVEGTEAKPKDLIDAGNELQDMVENVAGYRPTLDYIFESGDSFLDEIKEGTDELKASFTDAQTEAEGYKSQIEAADQTQQDFIDNLVNGLQNGVIKNTDELRATLNEAFSDAENGGEIVDGIMTEVQAQLDAAAAAAADYADGQSEVSEATEAAGRSVEDILADVSALGEAYKQAYDAAYSSMDGQFKLFESAEDKIKKMHEGWDGGTKGMKSGVDSQTQYVEEYTQNLDAAKKKLEDAGVSAETARTILASLSDGSADSAAALESIATGTEEDAKALAESYEALELAKSNFSSAVAEIQTNFTSSMNGLVAELTSTVKSMDKSTEAATSARSTLSAYVNAADGYRVIAAQKYRAVAKAAVDAMNAELKNLKTPGYASGTTSAKPGMAIVGEEGPELVMFRGGETVLNAQETEKLAKNNAEAVTASANNTSVGGSNYTIDFKPQFNITGNANAAEIRTVLEEQSENLREQVEGVIKDLITNQNRRSYA